MLMSRERFSVDAVVGVGHAVGGQRIYLFASPLADGGSRRLWKASWRYAEYSLHRVHRRGRRDSKRHGKVQVIFIVHLPGELHVFVLYFRRNRHASWYVHVHQAVLTRTAEPPSVALSLEDPNDTGRSNRGVFLYGCNTGTLPPK